MSERDNILLLTDIEEAIKSILDYTRGYHYEDYENDLKTRHATERNFEIIGEAAARLSDSFKSAYPEVEWRILKDFRNVIIHDYFGINHEIVWQTIKENLPGLLNTLRGIRNK